ncbi:MAG: hypothetical protein FJ100_20895 [Deltaproteobacteria bacterium]|nr:hypothetical protein [Deltaproteobacteria bacterium]
MRKQFVAIALQGLPLLVIGGDLTAQHLNFEAGRVALCPLRLHIKQIALHRRGGRLDFGYPRQGQIPLIRHAGQLPFHADDGGLQVTVGQCHFAFALGKGRSEGCMFIARRFHLPQCLAQGGNFTLQISQFSRGVGQRRRRRGGQPLPQLLDLGQGFFKHGPRVTQIAFGHAQRDRNVAAKPFLGVVVVGRHGAPHQMQGQSALQVNEDP